MGMTDRDLSDRPMVFNAQGFLVAILTGADEAERAVTALQAAGFADRKLRVYASEQMLADHDLHRPAQRAPPRRRGPHRRPGGSLPGYGRVLAWAMDSDLRASACGRSAGSDAGGRGPTAPRARTQLSRARTSLPVFCPVNSCRSTRG